MVSSRRAVLPEGRWRGGYTRRAAGRDGKGAGLAAGSVAAGPEAVGSAAAGAALARKELTLWMLRQWSTIYTMWNSIMLTWTPRGVLTWLLMWTQRPTLLLLLRRRLDAPGAAAAAPGWQEGILEAPTKLDSRAAAGVKEEPDSGGGGGGVGMGVEVLFPVPAHLTKSGRLFICDACLKYSNSPTAYERHLAKCRQIHPPGEEVYRCRLLPPNPAAPSTTPPHKPVAGNLIFPLPNAPDAEPAAAAASTFGGGGIRPSTVAAVSGRGTYCGEFDAHEEKNEAKAAGAAAAGGGGTMGADGGGGGGAAAAGGTMGADGGAGGTTGTGLEKQAADGDEEQRSGRGVERQGGGGEGGGAGSGGGGMLHVFRVDPMEAKLFCQCLCLLGKLFLEHKPRVYTLEGHTFYVLTRSSDTWHTFIGYFAIDSSPLIPSRPLLAPRGRKARRATRTSQRLAQQALEEEAPSCASLQPRCAPSLPATRLRSMAHFSGIRVGSNAPSASHAQGPPLGSWHGGFQKLLALAASTLAEEPSRKLQH
ncbi:hypothetical protein CLOM_g8269 [Closterium sp. NIES-68]|nr:hypothetical protein CLOM_g8269 [Closterium sp. NIES-68]